MSYQKSFDAKQAEEDGMIKPKKGLDPVYDASLAAVEEVENWFQRHLVEQCREFKCKVRTFIEFPFLRNFFSERKFAIF